MNLTIDIVCPVYNNYKQIKELYELIQKQKNITVSSMVCPLTIGNEEETNNIEKFFIEKKIKYWKLKKEEFSHSLTRELAIRDYCSSKIVVLMSQNIKLINELSIYNLVKDINDIDIVYTYGRQICSNYSIERYIRKKNYPKESFVVGKNDIESKQLMAFFASDAFSAINRDIFIKLNGYSNYNVMMNEEQLYSYFVLNNDYKKKYCADAIVEHSRKYTLKQLYKRYYDTGIFYKNVKLFDNYKSTNSGLKLAIYVFFQALIHFNIIALLRWLPDMAVRYLGMKKGKNGKEKSIKKNFFYNLIYQIFAIITPIITTPYISRVLQSYGVGQFAFACTIVNYFVLFANLGFSYYGQREIAKYQDDKKKQSKVFYEIVILKAISSLFSLLLYFATIQIPYFGEYRFLLYMLIPQILSVTIDTSFFFLGNEDFKGNAIRNTLVKILSITAIFIFVKDENDLWIYTLIYSLSFFVSSLFLLLFIKKQLCKVDLKSLEIKKHIKPTLKLFIPVVAITIYTLVDRFMLNLMIKGDVEMIVDNVTVIKHRSDIQIGNYDQAEKIVKLVNTFSFALSSTLIPRNSYYFENKMYSKIKDNVIKSVKFVYFITIPAMLGIICIASNFSPWFYGDGYEQVPLLLQIFSPFLIFSGLNYILGNQFLIPIGKEKIYTEAVIIGAVSNVLLNFILIRYFEVYGAAIASVFSEFIVLSYEIYHVRDTFKIKEVIAPIIKYFDAGLIMFIIAFPISLSLNSSILNTMILIAIGFVIYSLLMIVFKEEYIIMILSKIFERIKNAFGKRKKY